jgi:hypothetical protein
MSVDRTVMFGLIALIAISFVALIVGVSLQ